MKNRAAAQPDQVEQPSQPKKKLNLTRLTVKHFIVKSGLRTGKDTNTGGPTQCPASK